jgi:hypothetical protein
MPLLVLALALALQLLAAGAVLRVPMWRSLQLLLAVLLWRRATRCMGDHQVAPSCAGVTDYIKS